MAIEAKCHVPKLARAATYPANKRPSLTPQELAEFMASLEEDEAFVDAVRCGDRDPEYND